MATSRRKPKTTSEVREIPTTTTVEIPTIPTVEVEIPWDMDNHYWKTIKQLNILGATITNNLRAYIPSYDQLLEAEDIMNTLTMVVQRYKYTHPEYRRELEQIDYHLSALAEINEHLNLKEWPTDSQGNPTKLSMYLETVLWHLPWKSE